VETVGVSDTDASTLIAIDGPVASGKSTLGAALAERLGYTYFDSGVIYRALTWLALARRVETHHARRGAKLAREMEIKVVRADPAATTDERQYTVLLNGEDVTWGIRSPEVDRNVSAVAAHRPVRAALTEGLRRIAEQGRMVMVGRDIGTVVLPDAGLKIFLTATAEERARRRFVEVQTRGVAIAYEAILADLHRRDALDGGREAAPMRPALDATIVDSDGRTVPELVTLLLAEAQGRAGSGDNVAAKQ
jgi:cytidylate kinase